MGEGTVKKSLSQFLEFFPYISAAVVFFLLRAPLLPLWWPDFHSDFALVGIMAEHTKAGSFPIYFYGQNYMGGLEWLTAAILSIFLDSGSSVSLDVLRTNSLLWWFAAWVAWVFAVRRWSVPASQLVGWLFAIGTTQLLQVSVLQELSPQFLFFGAVLLHLLGRFDDLKGKRGFVFGLLLGLAWWTNQSVVFFLLPALWLFQARPAEWHRSLFFTTVFSRAQRLHWLYLLSAFLILAGALIAVFGGLSLSQGPLRLKVPNGISLARDVALGLLVLQMVRALWILRATGKLKEALTPIFPAAAGFLIGFAPVWLGRLLGLYEKSYGVGLAILPYWHWPSQAGAIVLRLYELFFSGQLALTLVFTLVAALGLATGAWKAEKNILRYCGLVAFLNIAYVFFSDRALGVPIRYLYPAFIAMIVGVSLLATNLRPFWLRNTSIAALMALAAWSGIQSRNALLMRADELRPRRTNLENVVRVLQDTDVTHCWGDYWSSYLFTYLSEGETLVAPHPASPAAQSRYRPHLETVRAADPKCYLVREDLSPTAKIYFSVRNPWESK